MSYLQTIRIIKVIAILAMLAALILAFGQPEQYVYGGF